DRSCCVWAGVVFCLETMVARARDVDCGGSWRHATKRVGEGPCSQATAFSRWSICGLVWLQFCQRAHHRSHSSLRAAPAFCSARSQRASLAYVVHCQRNIADCLGWVQPYCVGGAFSDCCAGGHLFCNFVAPVLFIC